MNDDYCLWMGDIDPRMDESIIRNYFKFYNSYPLAIKLIKDKETNKNKNYCFIYFKNIYEANRTINKLKGKPIPNTSLTFKLNWANYLTSTNKTVYVGNLNPLVDDASLFNFFKSKYKSVSKVKIIADNGQSKRYGFITFKKENDYRRSLIEMNGVIFEGTCIKVREYKKKEEDENNENNKNDKNNKNYENNKKNFNDNNTNNQLELNNSINNNINNNERFLNPNQLNSNSFLTVSNSINKLNWISNANPINYVSIGINHDNYVNVNSNNNGFNQITSSNNYDKNNMSINFNSGLNGNREYNFLINNDINRINDINNINNINSDDINKNIINNNIKKSKRKVSNYPKLEILEEFDEITLRIKINETLNKMLEYYKETIIINGNRGASKLILYLIFV